MINIDDQQKLLLNISRKLKKRITVYAIGGTAMMFLGLKDATLDIDLVFEDEKDKDVFKEAALELGYLEMDSNIVYGVKENQPEMLTLGDERFDLFVVHVIDFVFSEGMQKRAEQIRQFEDKLVLKIADPHDIILMKCATERLKDIDDARNIIDSTKIDWRILIDESKHQIVLGKERAVFDLGHFLEQLKYKIKVDIPKEVIDELYSIIEQQAKEKQKKPSTNPS